MYIKRVILDGFKSYANRTTIEGWDPIFNAITGFNGTGKSNILDSICWVMGISKTERMRVQNQKQLIYKEGQTRVTKASVSVVFDNTDKDRSPVGYTNCNEITVTRQISVQNKNKYYVNGALAQAARVRDLFLSVSLDVNNPHFLIMQGMVTKVLNYGQHAILGMIEEAAGTKMYMEKKTQAEKTMAQKNIKMEEIKKIMDDQINPQLNKLRQEKRNFQKYQENNAKLKKNDKKIVACDYFKASEKEEKDREQLSRWNGEKQVMKHQLHRLKEDIEKENGKVTLLQANVELEGNKKLAEIQEKKGGVEKEVAKVDTQVNVSKKQLAKATKKFQGEEKSCEELKDKEAEAEAAFKKLEEEQKDFTDQINEVKDRVAKLEAQKLGLNQGGENSHGSTEAQLLEQKKTLAGARAEHKRLTGASKDAQREIKEKRDQAKREKGKFEKMDRENKRLKEQIDIITKDLARQKYDAGHLEQLKREVEQLSMQKEEIDNKYSREKSFAKRADFTLDTKRLPKDFNYKAIHGRLIKLVDVPAKFHRAFQEMGGGALFGVVTDDSHTAATILSKKAVRGRTTFFPLDRYAKKQGLDPRVWARAQQIGQIYCGTEVAKFDPKFQGVMNSTFGRYVICEDKRTAQLVMEQCNTPTVSLCGSTYKPDGEISGGKRHGGPGLLERFANFKMLDQKLKEVNNLLLMKRSQANQMEATRNKHQALSEKLENQNRRLANNEKRMQKSEFATLSSEADELEKNVTDYSQHIENLAKIVAKSADEVKKLEKSIRDWKKNRKQKMKEMENEIKKGRSELKSLQNREKKEKKKKNALLAQKNAAHENFVEKTEELATMRAALTEQENGLKELQDALEEKQKALEAVEAEEAAEKEQIENQNKEISKLKENVKNLEAKKHEKTMKLQELEQDLLNAERSLKDTQNKINHLSTKYPWIDEEKDSFNVPGSNYDFANINLEDLFARQAQLKSQQEELDRKLNKKVMHMLDSAETEYNDLKKKKETVQKDKSKIEQVIKELDRKKDETLKACFAEVNVQFKKIFSLLLKGAEAKLQPVKADVGLSSGVDIKVAFGGTWKESLSELSGGQRSLLALSLILAIAAKNPAPIYILDEIDAALDPSHTQNIGLMLQKQFKSSQFVIVSLKDGMFENANVLFRTEFVEGVSQVRKVRG